MSEKAIHEEILSYDTPNSVEINIKTLFSNNDGQLQANPNNAAAFWGARMVLSDQPAREKLLLFLHDHFAMSGEKVNSGIILVDYLNLMERMASRPFAEFIEEITLEPAMLLWLDMRYSTDTSPNENFARELLELFTLGIGNYTETDIKEAARALTGWGLRDRYEGQKQPEQTRKHFDEWVATDEPFIVSSYSRELYDSGPHTILGETQSFDVKSVSKLTAEHPATARHMAKKLWEFYAYPDPEEEVIDRLAAAFTKNKGVITETVKAIPELPEFWSERAVRGIVKSPVDFVVPILRQIIDPERTLAEESEDGRPPEQRLRSIANAVVFLCRQMGQFLLYPPDVAGWDWGDAWISSSTMLDRINLSKLLAGDTSSHVCTRRLIETSKANGVKTNEEAVDQLLAILDVEADPDQRALLIKTAEDADLVANAGDLPKASNIVRDLLQGVFSIPRFQMM
jgi:uncharacterized protein (DUF1800 family)